MKQQGSVFRNDFRLMRTVANTSFGFVVPLFHDMNPRHRGEVVVALDAAPPVDDFVDSVVTVVPGRDMISVSKLQ
eukprot:CAMPEP_0182928160 /NCGR_PEP_ID=MMETSP0105_2-20130417/15353_1 /TAXON_ID=81532 ORGANISM="Acanthoeca-like sp., Strain 10tr" /NCGR_SAMPLE_ID=MMETSP0105_2 /ASSEMBLY_ACC=CAM_ASM_000205 /LENGTH=74 /DNA_ID=CAMNT_0025066153 /DNA_START=611 /DNA_END=836 /DNA_ORIENTATION=+